MWPGGSRRHPTGGKYSRSGWVSLAGRGVEKVRLSGREALAGVRWEIKTHCRTSKDGKVKLGDLTGDGSSQPGWVRLSGRRVEKASFLLGGSGRK